MGYLTKSELKILENSVGAKIIGVQKYFLKYSDDLKVLQYLRLCLSNGELIFTTGNLAENIKVINSDDFVKELVETKNQEGVIVDEVNADKEDIFCALVGCDITSFSAIDLKGYCTNGIILGVRNRHLKIEAGVDELLVQVI